MRDNGIRARHKRRYKATTDSKHSMPVADNLLARNFIPAAPNRVWTGDITYDRDTGEPTGLVQARGQLDQTTLVVDADKCTAHSLAFTHWGSRPFVHRKPLRA